ncbi:MAG: phosphatase PAP2 family protein [Alphaproteobacteria bacterium]
MNISVTTFGRAAKPFAQAFLSKQVGIILGISLLLSLPLWLWGGDVALAHAVYNPHSSWAWAMRQYSNMPGAVVTVLMLLVLLIPTLYRRPAWRRLAVVWLAAAIIGGGLINQVLVNETVQRPRPRDFVLLEQPAAVNITELSGNSFPSGHATLGFMFAVPFFVWWPRRKKAALAALVAGLAAGGIIGYARMVLGAHFASDILWAGTIVAVTASMTAHLFTEQSRFSPLWIYAALLVAALGVVLGNSFKVTLVWQQPYAAVDIPLCAPALPLAPNQPFTLTLQGFGAPLSYLSLYETHGVVKLWRWSGVYHSLKCTIAPLAP